MKCTWRMILAIIGASLALAGIVCLVVSYSDKLMAGGASVAKAIKGKCKGNCSEFDDYDDDLMYE